MKIKVIIVEDHQILLQGLRSLLNQHKNIEIIGTATNCKEALRLFEKVLPDVLITDISLPDGNGIELYTKLKTKYDFKSICLTMHHEPMFPIKAYKAGMSGYLLKETDIDDIVNAIEKVQKGEKIFSPELFMVQFEEEKSISNELKTKLSKREIEIIQLISEGKSSKEIADVLFLSPYTVDTHRKNIGSKLQTKSVGQLISKAKELGLIS